MIYTPFRNFRAGWIYNGSGAVTADVVTSQNEKIEVIPYTVYYSTVWLIDIALSEAVTYCTINWYVDGVLIYSETYSIEPDKGYTEHTVMDVVTTKSVTEALLTTSSLSLIATYTPTQFNAVYKATISLGDPGQMFVLWKNGDDIVELQTLFTISAVSDYIPVKFKMSLGDNPYPNILVASSENTKLDGLTNTFGTTTLYLPKGDNLILLKDISHPDRWLSPSILKVDVVATDQIPMVVTTKLLAYDPPSTAVDPSLCYLKTTLRAGEHPLPSTAIEVRQVEDAYSQDRLYSRYTSTYYTDTYGRVTIPLIKNSLVDIKIPVLHYTYVFTVPDKSEITFDDVISEAWSNPQLITPELPEY
jgi:hypothetical protein